MTNVSRQFATILANIAAQAARELSDSSLLLLPGESVADAAVAFAWWSVSTAGDATEDGGDFRSHFRQWESERRAAVR